MRRTTTLQEYRSSPLKAKRQIAMTWAMIGGIIAGVVLPLLLLAFTALSPVVSLIAYIGLAICPFVFPAIASAVTALVFLFKANKQANLINSAPSAPEQVAQQQNQAPQVAQDNAAQYQAVQGQNAGNQAGEQYYIIRGGSYYFVFRFLGGGQGLYNQYNQDDGFDPSQYNLVDVPRTAKDEVPYSQSESYLNKSAPVYDRLIRLQDKPYNVDIESVHPEFFCPISGEIMREPVWFLEGDQVYHYNKASIKDWIKLSKITVDGVDLGWRSPMSNCWVASSAEIKNYIDLDNTIEPYYCADPFVLVDDDHMLAVMRTYAEAKEAELGITSSILNPATDAFSQAGAGQADHSSGQSSSHPTL